MGCGASNDQAAKASSPIAKSPQSDEKEKRPSAQYESKPVSVATTPLPAMAIVNSLSKLASDNSKLAPFISLINTSIEPTRQSTPAALCAVSLSFLINWAKAAPDSYTTADVCYSVVKPITQGAECRLTDTMHPSEIGPPNFFISHRWGMSFQELIANVRDQLPGADTTKVFCWVDIFAINQHHAGDDLPELEHAINICNGVLVILDKRGLLLTRIWCLYEIWKTVTCKGHWALKFVTNGFKAGDLIEVFSTLDAGKAEASVESDRVMILADIERTTGLASFNATLKTLFLLDPINAESDINPSLSFGHSAALNVVGEATESNEEEELKNDGTADAALLAEFDAWIQLKPEDEQYKAILFTGSQGTRKTRSAASFCLQRKSQVTAYHFVKASDERRKDPVSALKSILYQLSMRHREVQSIVVEAQGEDLQRLTSFDPSVSVPALSKLLIQGMEAVSAATATTAAVILIDGLDEGGSSNPGDNPLLLLLREHLAALPAHSFRFVFFTRPEPYISKVVEASWVKQHKKVELLGLKSDSGLTWLNHKVSHLSNMDEKQAKALSAVISTTSEGSFIYGITVLRVLGSLLRAHGSGPLNKMVPKDLSSALTAFIDASKAALMNSSAGAMAGQNIEKLFSILSAANEPPTFALLTKLGIPSSIAEPTFLSAMQGFLLRQGYSIALSHGAYKSWLTESGAKRTADGHKMLAEACSTDISAWLNDSPANKAMRLSAYRPLSYSLRHGLTHMALSCTSNKELSTFESTMSSVVLWHCLYSEGTGSIVLQDLVLVLSSPGASKLIATSEVVKETIRWLRSSSELHSLHPNSVLQSSIALPESSIVRKSAQAALTSLGLSPPKLINTAEEQSTQLGTIRGGVAYTSVSVSSTLGPSSSSSSGLIVAGDWNGSIHLHDLVTGRPAMAKVSAHYRPVQTVAIFASGSELIVSLGTDGAMVLTDSRTGQVVGNLFGHTATVTTVALAPDGAQLASASSDGMLVSWNAVTQQQNLRYHLLPPKVNIPGAARTSGGGMMPMRGGPPPPPQFNNNQQQQRKDEEPCALAYSPDSKLLAAATSFGTVHLLSSDNFQVIWKCTSFGGGSQKDPITCLQFSPDGSKLAVGTSEHQVPMVVVLDVNNANVLGKAWPPSGGRSISRDMTIAAIAWGSTSSSLPQYAVTKNAMFLQLWSPSNDKWSGKALIGHEAKVLGASFASDASLLVSCGEDGQIKSWEVGQPVQPPASPSAGARNEEAEHRCSIQALQFSSPVTPSAPPRLYSLDGGGCIKVWDLSNNGSFIGQFEAPKSLPEGTENAGNSVTVRRMSIGGSQSSDSSQGQAIALYASDSYGNGRVFCGRCSVDGASIVSCGGALAAVGAEVACKDLLILSVVESSVGAGSSVLTVTPTGMASQTSWKDDEALNTLTDESPSSANAKLKSWSCSLPMTTGDDEQEALSSACYSEASHKMAYLTPSMTVAIASISSQDPLTFDTSCRISFSLPSEMAQLSTDDVYMSFSPLGQSLAIGVSSRYESRVGVWDASAGQCIRLLPSYSTSIGGLSFVPESKKSYSEREQTRLGVMLPRGKSGRVEAWSLEEDATEPQEVVYLGAGGKQFLWGVGGEGGVFAFVPSLGYRVSMFGFK